MSSVVTFLLPLLVFGLMALASREVGKYVQRFGLPLISGYLLVGILVGPYGLGLLEREHLGSLRFVGQVSLAFIGFAAGGELDVAEIRARLRSILTVLAGQMMVVVPLGMAAVWFLAPRLPFLSGFPPIVILAIGLLTGAIMTGRSPASAYAVIRELRARGPFTQAVLGITVLTDGVVIFLFALAVSLISALLEGGGLDRAFFLLLGTELVLDLLIGVGLGLLIRALFATALPQWVKGAGLLTLGYTLFALASLPGRIHIGDVGLFTEPLLIAMVAGLYLVNFTPHRNEFHKVVEGMSAWVFVFFFTLVGSGLDLSLLQAIWQAALLLVILRALGLLTGSVLGGIAARDPTRHAFLYGLAFLTQAGVSIGLSQEVAIAFPGWGEAFATLMVAMIVVDLMLGPPLLKGALRWAGEARAPVGEPSLPEAREAILFGSEGFALSLYHRLTRAGWRVRLLDPSLSESRLQALAEREIPVTVLPDLAPETLRRLEVQRASVLILLLPDDDLSYQLCERLRQVNVGGHIAVCLRDSTRRERFRELDVFVVDASLAFVDLLEIFAHSPTTTTILLGLEEGQEVVDLRIRNQEVDGLRLRDLHLPPEVLILSLRRDEHLIVPLGYTRLALGDEVVLMGPPPLVRVVEDWLSRPDGGPFPSVPVPV